jgi:hypothetical protein
MNSRQKKKDTYLLKHFKIMNFMLLSRMNHLSLKALLLITCEFRLIDF